MKPWMALAPWLLALALAAVEMGVDPAVPGDSASARPASERVYEFDRAEARRLRLSAGSALVELRRGSDGWAVVEGADVAPGLIEALLEQLEVTAEAPRVAASGVAADLGLDPPRAVIEVRLTDGAPLTLLMGGASPTDTSVYARVGADGPIVVAGRSLAYYTDLALGASR